MLVLALVLGCADEPRQPVLHPESSASPRPLPDPGKTSGGVDLAKLNQELDTWARRRSQNHIRAERPILQLLQPEPKLKQAFLELHQSTRRLKKGPEPFYEALDHFEAVLKEVGTPFRYTLTGKLGTGAINITLQSHQVLARIEGRVDDEARSVDVVWHTNKGEAGPSVTWTPVPPPAAGLLHGEGLAQLALHWAWPAFEQPGSRVAKQLALTLDPVHVAVLTRTAPTWKALHQADCEVDLHWFGLSQEAWEQQQADPCPGLTEVVKHSETLTQNPGLLPALNRLAGSVAWTIAVEPLIAGAICADCTEERAREVTAWAALAVTQIDAVHGARLCRDRPEFCGPGVQERATGPLAEVQLPSEVALRGIRLSVPIQGYAP